MQPERKYAATVLTGLAALALCFAFQASAPVIVGASVVYAAAGYYTAEHPDAVGGRREGGWENGALAGVATFGTIGVVEGTHDGGVIVLAFGLLWFGFVNGVSYARDRTVEA